MGSEESEEFDAFVNCRSAAAVEDLRREEWLQLVTQDSARRRVECTLQLQPNLVNIVLLCV